MMAGILRCVLILTAGAKSAEQAGSWAVRETFVAVVVSNMPIIFSFLRGIFKSLSEYTISISKRSTACSSRHMRLGDISGSRDRPVRSGRSHDPYPITYSSLEHIIQEGADSESKLRGHRHLQSCSSTAESGPLSSKAFEGPATENHTRHIMVATRTEVRSEAAPQTLRKSNSGTDEIYQCRVSIEGDSSYPKK